MFSFLSSQFWVQWVAQYVDGVYIMWVEGVNGMWVQWVVQDMGGVCII